MRIHTDTLEFLDIHQALSAVKHAGLVADHVHLEILSRHGSRKRAHAFEVQLGTYEKHNGDKRSWKNSGTHGADSDNWGQGLYAATYDEWGYFLAALYLLDSKSLWCQYHGDFDGFIENTRRRGNSRQRVFNYITPASTALNTYERKVAIDH